MCVWQITPGVTRRGQSPQSLARQIRLVAAVACTHSVRPSVGHRETPKCKECNYVSFAKRLIIRAADSAGRLDASGSEGKTGSSNVAL